MEINITIKFDSPILKKYMINMNVQGKFSNTELAIVKSKAASSLPSLSN